MTSSKKLEQVVKDIEEVLAGMPHFASKADKIAAVTRHVRIKKPTIEKFL